MRVAILGVIVAALASSASAADMKVSFDWGPTKKCFDSKSPPMKLSGVPKGTVRLDIRMKDMNVPGYSHGGGKTDYKGDSLAYGAVRYRGPCPPTGKHKYRFTVKALDAKGKALATATADRMFP